MKELRPEDVLSIAKRLSKEIIEKDLNNLIVHYYKVFPDIPHKGFGENGVKECISALYISSAYKEVGQLQHNKMYKDFAEELYIEIYKVLVGDITPLDFSFTIEGRLNKYDFPIQIWHELYNYYDKDHKWLENHTLGKPFRYV